MDSRGVGEIIIYFVVKQTFMPFPKPSYATNTQLSLILKRHAKRERGNIFGLKFTLKVAII
jgi:hypothetical protein